ncbi:urate hydroxylase PuuD [Teredinibacter turnerae]|uniref:urate hydroxylase PuuD n=1 Tax=Teredinibacter turnerae TaxID=2426 RepID=UPI0005F8899C|nr:urate hydroxylase PuuD [Teredinibacter turnerae]
MDALLLDWLSLLLRWLHVITAIAWIGASFYFVWLDNSLETPPEWKKEKGVSGDLWAFHGGGIYEVAKYSLAPPTMPTTLHWFKWEAYSTWLTGALLLIAVYYFRAEYYLVGPNNLVASPALAISASVLYLASGLAVYELLVRWIAPKNTRLFIALLYSYVAFSCWLAPQLFSDRAAFIHVGALLATIMAANVFLGIMPAQRGFMRAVDAGKMPDKAPMLVAKTRSIHNNYFTLPVIFCMISNHYAFLYGHPYNWLILIALLTITAYARHFFNLRHRGVIKPSILILAVAATLAVAAAMQIGENQKLKQSGGENGRPSQPIVLPSVADQVETDQIQAKREQAESTKARETVTNEQITELTNQHCSGCHAIHPSNPAFAAAPAGILLETTDQLLTSKQKIIPAVQSGYMPLGNMTGMTQKERETLLEWLAQTQ